MQREQIDFGIEEAGCLLYLADRNLDGHPFSAMSDFFDKQGGLQELTLKGAVMAMGLYQDNGYSVRIVRGDLTGEEKSQWISKVSWKLNLESGKLVVSGVCFPGFEEYIEDFEFAGNDGEYEFGCLAECPAGVYQTDVYSYPPNDLAGGLLMLESKREYRSYFGDTAGFEKTLDYFYRTHPNETAPVWIRQGYEDAPFLDFLIHLSPISDELPLPEFDEDENCLKWIYRKPEICPVGIRWKNKG